MATIQVRDIDEQAYATMAERARAENMSIQRYMKREIERLAARPDDRELFAEIEHHVQRHGTGIDRAELLGHLDHARR